MRNWPGPEQTKYMVNLQVQRGTSHRRPFWTNICVQSRPPPIDLERFMDWLRDVCYRKSVRLPATVCVFRSHAQNEHRGFHFIVKLLLSDEGYYILKGYAGTRGIPHTQRNEDYPWKYNSLPDKRLDVRNAILADPAGHVLLHMPDVTVEPPSPFEEVQPVTFEFTDQAGEIRNGVQPPVIQPPVVQPTYIKPVL